MKRGDLVRVCHPDGWTYTLGGRVRAGSTCLVLEVDRPQHGHFATVLIDDGRVDRINQRCLEESMKYRIPRVDPYPVGSLVVSMLNPSTPVYRQPVEYVLRCIYHWPQGEIGIVTGEPVDRKAPVLVNGIQGWVAMDSVRLTTETDDDVLAETK